MKTIDQIRRDNLAILIKEAQGVRKFVTKTNKSDPQVRQWLDGTPNSSTGKPRVVSNDIARELEVKCGKVIGWMDHDHSDGVKLGYVTIHALDIAALLGHGYLPADFPQAADQIELSEQWLRDNFGSIDPGQLRIMTCQGDSMKPTILQDDIVFLHTGVRFFQGDGIYVITFDGTCMIRQLIKERKRIEIKPHNPVYSTHSLGPDEPERLQIFGRVLKWWSLKS